MRRWLRGSFIVVATLLISILGGTIYLIYFQNPGNSYAIPIAIQYLPPVNSPLDLRELTPEYLTVHYPYPRGTQKIHFVGPSFPSKSPSTVSVIAFTSWAWAAVGQNDDSKCVAKIWINSKKYHREILRFGELRKSQVCDGNSLRSVFKDKFSGY